jgi:hypothetical protein
MSIIQNKIVGINAVTVPDNLQVEERSFISFGLQPSLLNMKILDKVKIRVVKPLKRPATIKLRSILKGLFMFRFYFSL